MPDRRPVLGERGIRVLLAVVLLALAGAALALNWPAGGGGSKKLAVPVLYPRPRLTVVQRLSTAPRARAARDFATWVAAHPARDDTGFAAFALAHVGAPPSGPAEKAERDVLQRLGAHRTPAGVRAATWLESHGKKDIWKLYLKQAGQLVGPTSRKREKTTFKATYKLALLLASQGKLRFARLSPYIADPSLHALNQSRFGGTKKYSYPAKHALLSSALSLVLTRDEPPRAGEFRWMADEVSYSRMYAGGHYPSDIAAGVYLGTLAGLYEARLAG